MVLKFFISTPLNQINSLGSYWSFFDSWIIALSSLDSSSGKLSFWLLLNFLLLISQVWAKIDNVLYEKVLHQVQLALKTHTYDIHALKAQVDVLLGKNSKLEAEVITLKNEIKILKGKPVQCKAMNKFTTENLIMITAGNPLQRQSKNSKIIKFTNTVVCD